MIDTWRVRVRAEFEIELPSEHSHMSTDEVMAAARERLEDSLGHVDIPYTMISGVLIEGRWYEPVPWADGAETRPPYGAAGYGEYGG